MVTKVRGQVQVDAPTKEFGPEAGLGGGGWLPRSRETGLRDRPVASRTTFPAPVLTPEGIRGLEMFQIQVCSWATRRKIQSHGEREFKVETENQCNLPSAAYGLRSGLSSSTCWKRSRNTERPDRGASGGPRGGPRVTHGGNGEPRGPQPRPHRAAVRTAGSALVRRLLAAPVSKATTKAGLRRRGP